MIENLPDLPALLQGVASARAVGASLQSVGSEALGVQIASGLLVVTPGGCIPVIDGKTSFSAFLEYNPTKYSALLETSLIPQACLEGGFFFTGSLAYYHFMVHALPALLFLQAMPERPSMSAFTMLGGPDVAMPLTLNLAQRLSNGRVSGFSRLEHGVYELKDIVIPCRARRGTVLAFHRELVFPALIGVPMEEFSGGRATKLFVRRASPRRRLVNEAEIEAYLVSRGYQPVDPGSLPLAEQARLFAHASHIVGVEGAGLTNLLFAAQAERVIMLASPATRGETFFDKLAPIADLETVYGALVDAAVDSADESAMRAADFSLPLCELQALLERDP